MREDTITVKMPARSAAKISFLLMALLLVVLAGIAVYANVWKGSRRVVEVTVEGNRIVAAKDILALAKVPANNLMFDLDLYAIEQRILKNEYVKSAAVYRDIPNRIRITIEERVPVVAIVLERLCYLDDEGVILPPARSQFIFDLPLLTGMMTESELTYGKPTTNKNVLQGLEILSVAKAVDKEMYRNISEICLEANKGFVFYTAEFGVPVVLGRGDIGTKLVKFEGFWKSVVSRNSPEDLQYIDLRFNDQVVVQWSTSPIQNRESGDTYS
jgi:cell division septal protein FtsQ